MPQFCKFLSDTILWDLEYLPAFILYINLHWASIVNLIYSFIPKILTTFGVNKRVPIWIYFVKCKIPRFTRIELNKKIIHSYFAWFTKSKAFYHIRPIIFLFSLIQTSCCGCGTLIQTFKYVVCHVNVIHFFGIATTFCARSCCSKPFPSKKWLTEQFSWTNPQDFFVLIFELATWFYTFSVTLTE